MDLSTANSTWKPQEIAGLMIRDYENHWFPLIRPAISWGGVALGGWHLEGPMITANLPLKSYHFPNGNASSEPTHLIFGGKLAVSFREGMFPQKK